MQTVKPLSNGGRYDTPSEVKSFFKPLLEDGSIHGGMSTIGLLNLCGTPASTFRTVFPDKVVEFWWYGNYQARLESIYDWKTYRFVFINNASINWYEKEGVNSEN